MASSETKSKRVVRFLSVDYFDPDVDPLTGNDVRFIRSARRGTEVELVASEEKRLDALDALLPKGAKKGDEVAEHEAILDLYRGQRGDTEAMGRAVKRASEGQKLPLDMSGGIEDVSLESSPPENTGRLADRISAEKLTVDDTVALAGDDPAHAKRVLEAERLASGGTPRQGVESKLQKIIDGD